MRDERWELLHTLGGRLGGSQPTGPVKNVWVSSVVLGHAETKIWVDALFLFGVLCFFSDLGGGSKVKMMILYSNGNLGFIRIPCYPKKGMRISIIMSQNGDLCSSPDVIARESDIGRARDGRDVWSNMGM